MSQTAIAAYDAAVNSGLNDHSHWDVIEAEWHQIKAKYPLLFNGDDIGTQVGPGWWPILEELMAGLTTLVELTPGAHINVVQIKEKFGGLRFYMDMGGMPRDSRVYQVADELVQYAESRAAHTCEACGEPGTRGGKNWIKTYCEKHAAEQAKRDKRG
jgi:hypothetical protein